MAAALLLDHFSRLLVLTNDTLLALNISLLSTALRADGHSVSWTAALMVYGFSEALQTIVVYIQDVPISATLFAFSGVTNLGSQLLIVLDRLRKQEKEEQARQYSLQEKGVTADEEHAAPAEPAKTSKWHARMVIWLPMYFVATASASTLFLHDSIKSGTVPSAGGEQWSWDFGLKMTIMAIIVCSQACSLWMAGRRGSPAAWFAGGNTIQLGSMGVMIVLLMRFVTRYLLQTFLEPSVPLTWPPVDMMYEAVQKYGLW